MTSNADASRHGELTDEQLDQLLEATNEELLDHLRATADPSRTLIAIMADSSSPEAITTQDAAGAAREPQSRAAMMISMRARTRDLDRALNTARAQTRTLALTLDKYGQARTLELHPKAVVALDRFCWPVRRIALAAAILLSALGIYTFVLGLGVGALATLVAIVGFFILPDPNHARIRALNRAYNRVHALERAVVDAYIHASSPDRAAFRSYNHGLGRSRVRALDRALDRAYAVGPDHGCHLDRPRLAKIKQALDSIREIVRAIATLPVDASGADLSHMEIGDLDVLDGVVWTRQTTWPPGIADKVRRQSDEIMAGTYQVRIGETPDRSGLTRV